MRVALLSYGFAEYCIQQANGLARECDVQLLLPRSEAADCESLLDPAVHYVPFEHPRLRQPARQLLNTARLMRAIQRFKPDVIHFQHGHMWFNLALPALRKYPLVVTIHDPRHHVGDRTSRKTPQALMDFGFRRADRIIVHGEVLKRQVVERLGIAADGIHIMPHVAIGKVEIASHAEHGPPQVLFFGRIWKYKGLEFLIRAQPMISAAIPDAQIVIAGEGDEFGPYRQMMSQPDRFVVHNRYISGGERDELFRRASVVVLPYIEATQSGVIPLAYAFGKPVVATNTGALSEAVEDGITGRLVPPGDVFSIGQAVIELLRDREKQRQMGAAGQRKLITEWSPEVVAQQTMAVYRRAIQARTSQRHKAIAPCPAPSAIDHRISST